jgi:fumarate hydratase subunit beta
MKIYNLKIPLSESDISRLRVGEIVTLTGTLWTCGSRFHIRVVEEEVPPPIDTAAYNVMLHGAPIVTNLEGCWKLKAQAITTSIRFERWEPEAIERLELRAIIGKGRVGERTLSAMKKFGCIHLIRSGLFAGPYATMVERIKEVHWLDLGKAEAIWVIEVKGFGPLIVEADITGKSLYKAVGKGIDETIPGIYKKLSVEDVVYHEK